MKVALAIVCSEKLDTAWQPYTLPFNMVDNTIAHVPVLIFDDNINDIRKRLHYIVDALCDRSDSDMFFKE